MKNKILYCLFVWGLILSINSCSTPEERATVVDGADSSNTSTSQSNSTVPGNEGDSAMNSDSSSTSNRKVQTFKHTPIDTITSKSDTLKQ